MASSAVIYPEQTSSNLHDLLELVGLPSETERATKQLSGSAKDFVRSVVSIVDSMVRRTIEERTSESFVKIRAEIFPQYFAAMVSLGSLLTVIVSPHDMDWMVTQSLSELEAEFREGGAAAFGLELRDRGIFTVYALRKISDLAGELKGASAPKVNRESLDRAKNFAVKAVWSRFHIDCLIQSMRSRQPIFPDVTENIVDGLRAAVDAYAFLREEVDIRLGLPEPELPKVQPDADDRMFIADSMRDLARETHDEH